MFPGCLRRGQIRRGNKQQNIESSSITIINDENLSMQTSAIVQIYTDWANHYLEKHRSKKRITTLATDCSDGVLLADIIESVINHKVPDINRKPKTSLQMLDNINSCLSVLRSQNIVGIENISSTELREGRLKAVLSLFFALSRFKQSMKMQQQQQGAYYGSPIISLRHSNNNAKHVSNIPQPSSALVTRKATATALATTTSIAQQQSLSCISDHKIPKIASTASSTVAHYQNPNQNLNHKPHPNQINSIPVTSSSITSLTSTSTHIHNSNGNLLQHSLIPRVPAVVSQQQQQSLKNGGSVPGSMLEKIKLFKNPDKSGSLSNKRTSSSSGVSSSNRSEKSDGSMSSLTDQNVDLTATAMVTKVSKNSKLRPRSLKSSSSSSGTKSQHLMALSSSSQSRKESSTNSLTKTNNASKIAIDVEKHAQKIANLSLNKLSDPKLANRLSASSASRLNLTGSQTSVNQISTGIPKPTAAIKGTTKQMKDDTKTTTTVPVVAKTQTVALISPMPVTIEPTHETGCTEKVVVETKNNEKIDSSQQKSILTEEDATAIMNVVPMKPLMRAYSSNFTLPGRSPKHNPYHQQQQPLKQQDYCDMVVNGYLSESETFRDSGFSKINDINDGYLSESGVSIYSRKAQHVPNGFRHPRFLVPSLGVLTEQQRSLSPVPVNSRQRHLDDSNSGDTNANQTKDLNENGTGANIVIMPGSDSRKIASRHHHHQQQQQQQQPQHHRGRSSTPQGFGYVKKGLHNGQIAVTSSSTSNVIGAINGNGASDNNKNAPVIVRTTKVKVSGGTQTCSSDLQQPSPKPNLQYKSYSLTGNTASQLSQSIRERLISGSQSLPKSAGQEVALVMRQHHGRSKISDGSLSDTQVLDNGHPYGAWIRHSNTYSVGPRLSETDSLESLASLQSHRNSLTQTRLIRDPTIRLSRSNSISSRSSKSDKFYPGIVNRNSETESDSYYCLPVANVITNWSQPSSPGHVAQQAPIRSFPLSPTHSNFNANHSRQSHSKDDEVHGSSVSLISTASSIYSSAEEKHAHEIRKLRKELREAHEKVYTLTSQLKTNAHVVSAFEQSLTSMSTRLQNLTATSEKKDSELIELRTAMENLRVQSVQVGLVRQTSSDSVSSLSSACSGDKQDRKKKKGWLRSSFTKAFSRTSKISKIQTQADISETESSNHISHNNTNINNAQVGHQQQSPQHVHQQNQTQNQQDKSTEVVAELQKQLREKDMVLTDIRLEALSSAHQLESLKDTVMKMKSEMMSLKQNNERLQRIVGGCTPPVNIDEDDFPLIDPVISPTINDYKTNDVEAEGKTIAISVYLGQPQCFNRYYIDIYENGLDCNSNLCETAISFTKISNMTTWSYLDDTVRKAFKQHIHKLDPSGALGLGPEAVVRYRLGDAERVIDDTIPELLPVGYTIGKVSKLHLILQPIAAFAFEALIPRGVAQRLVALFGEQKRIVLCGASGTGKSYLANRLAEFYTYSQGRDPAEAVATFNVDNKSTKDLKQYLLHLSDQAASGNTSMLPTVVVLDNLHRAGSLTDCLGTLPRSLPCLIGTMVQVACSATSLQLQHGFRWVHIAPHMEPTRGLLGRVLQRRLISHELSNGSKSGISNVFSWLPRVWQHINTFLETHNSGDVAIGPRLFLSCPIDMEESCGWFSDVWNYSIAPYLKEAAQEGLRLYGRRAPWIDPTKFVLETYPWPNQPPQGLLRIGARDVGLETNSPSKFSENSSNQNFENNNNNNNNSNDPLLNMLIRLQEAANYSSPNSVTEKADNNNVNLETTAVTPALQRI